MDVSSQELRNRKSVPHIDFKPRKYNAVRIELRIQIIHRLYQMPPPTYYYVSLSAKSQASALLARWASKGHVDEPCTDPSLGSFWNTHSNLVQNESTWGSNHCRRSVCPTFLHCGWDHNPHPKCSHPQCSGSVSTLPQFDEERPNLAKETWSKFQHSLRRLHFQAGFRLSSISRWRFERGRTSQTKRP